jgi:hypothetical protein
MRTKLLRAYGGCLGDKSRRRARLAAKSLGELSASVISEDTRMGEPTWGNAHVPLAEYIGQEGGTGGTETSKYPKEERSFPE